MADGSTLTLFVGRYADTDAASADYDTITEEREERFRTTFDAAVVENSDGSATIVHHHETPIGMGATVGVLAGAALGMFFPPLLLAMAAGAGIGAVVGHLTRGMSRSDIKEIGEALDEACAALVVVVATSHAGEIRMRMPGAIEVTEREIRASAQDIDTALEEVARDTADA